MHSIRKPDYRPHLYKRGIIALLLLRKRFFTSLKCLRRSLQGCQVEQNLLAYMKCSVNNIVTFIDNIVNLIIYFA